MDFGVIRPRSRCNMDEGSHVCLQDEQRCPRHRITAPDRTVASIPDAELLRRVVRSVAPKRRRPTAALSRRPRPKGSDHATR